jgi:hypothetical protein
VLAGLPYQGDAQHFVESFSFDGSGSSVLGGTPDGPGCHRSDARTKGTVMDITIDAIRALDRAAQGVALDARDQAALGVFDEPRSAPIRKGVDGSAGRPTARSGSWTQRHFETWTASVLRLLSADETDDQAATDAHVNAVMAALKAHCGTREAAHHLQGLLTPVFIFLRGVNAKNRVRNARLDAIEARVTALDASATTRVLPPVGAYVPGKSYAAGQLIKRKGSVWQCVRDTATEPGAAPGDWSLFVKGVETP